MSSGDEETSVREEWVEREGKKIRRLFDAAGVLFEESVCDDRRRKIEKKSLRADGSLSGITLFEYADEVDWRYKKMTQLDPEGDIILIQERGSPPVIGELYRGEKAFMVYPKKKAIQLPEPRPCQRSQAEKC